MCQSMVDFFKKTFQYRGRASRKDFWVPNIILLAAGLLLNSGKTPKVVESTAAAVSVLPTISLTSRRYQDVGISGWFQLPQYLSILLMPIVFMKFVKRWVKAAVITIIAAFNIIGFIFTLLPSDGDNKFGKKCDL